MAARIGRVLLLVAAATWAGLVLLRRALPARPVEAPGDPVWPPLEPEAAWVEPVDGACPDGYPVKAKLSSGIFHEPGVLNYGRCRPDRCYRDAEAARADGLRPAKR